jgi:hypothetical protein
MQQSESGGNKNIFGEREKNSNLGNLESLSNAAKAKAEAAFALAWANALTDLLVGVL